MSKSLVAVLGVFACIALAPGTTSTQNQQRESIFDRVVHLEATAISDVPEVDRWEDRLGIVGRRISVGDAELWVEEQGSGPAIVLINGGPGGTHHGFHPWFGRAADFARVIYYDQRGCGLSAYEPGPDGYSVEQAVEDLESLRKVLGIDKFVLLGFSYGGFLAQFYTVSHPENVAGLVLVGASPGTHASTGRSRQQQFISPEEREHMQRIRDELRGMAQSRSWSPDELLALLVYNNHINGDWKRQHYYKPSQERMAQIALYEWVHDGNFNGVMSQSQSRVDLTGAFEANPIPTLIMEGEWDLTWGEEKRAVIARNHPNARMVTFQKAGHSIFNEDSEAFFRTLREFVQDLAPVDPGALATFEAELGEWREAWMASPAYNLSVMDWGKAASEEIAEAFSPAWVQETIDLIRYLRLGFALYDVERYEEALGVFARLGTEARLGGDERMAAVGAIWEGHMLDLLGRREEALARYRVVVEMDVQASTSHDQYGLRYVPSPYAAERLMTPFTRIENRMR